MTNLVDPSEPRIAVIGAGITGVTTAYNLARRGCHVTLFDKHPYAAIESLGDRVNVYPVKGYSITVSLPDAADQAAAPWVSLLDDKAKIVTSRLGPPRFRVAGTAEFNGVNPDIRAERVAPLVRWCRAHFPGISTRQAVPCAGKTIRN